MSENNTISITLTDISVNNILTLVYSTIMTESEVQKNLEKDKIAASKAKFETAMKTLNKNGGLDKLVEEISKKFLG